MAAQIVKLSTADGQTVEVPVDIAIMFGTIGSMVEDTTVVADGTPIPLPDISIDVLNKLIEWCTYHHGRKNTDETAEWDTKFCELDQVILFKLILAVNYLDNKVLLDLLCLTIANMIKGKTPEEIRQTFNIKNDFTPEEEEEIRKENEWCEDAK